MIVIPDGVKVVEQFSDSVTKLMDDIVKTKDWIMENDPDPDTTSNYMITKKVREWLNNRGNLPY